MKRHKMFIIGYIIILAFVISLQKQLAYAQVTSDNTSQASSTQQLTDEERRNRAYMKAKLDPFSIINNFGYNNSYWNLYKKGIINTPPPFGGPITNIITGCYEGKTWVTVGAPRPGWFVHSPAVTRTYPFGPPRHVGQYLLGLFGLKHFCVKSYGLAFTAPEGFLITMMGSSR